MTNQTEEVVEITEDELKAYEADKELKNAILKLKANRNFKIFEKSFIEKSLIQLGLNLGINPQMRGEINLQIEARRIFNEFIEQAITQGSNAEEILNGVE